MTPLPRDDDSIPRGQPIVPGSIHRVDVGPRDDRGRGSANLGRRSLRIPNGLPDETVDVRLVHVGRTTADVRIERVVHASPDRIVDACPHGTVCPGCGMRTTHETARRTFLRGRVAAALAKEGLVDVPVLETVGAPAADGWRQKAFLTARRTSRGIFLGLYEEHSHRLLGIDGCPAHAEPVERALYAVRQALKRSNPSIYDERGREGWLRYVAVRASLSTGKALVTFVATGRDFGAEQGLIDLIRRLAPHVTGFVLNVHEETGNAPFGARFLPLAGDPFLTERSGGFDLRVSAGSFFQVNPAMAERLHDAVARAARTGPPGPAVDLYGGVGCTARRLAADGRKVTLVESLGSAALDAQWNARAADDGPAAFEVVTDRVESALSDGRLAAPSVVVANPPRSGLSAGVLERILAWKPPLLLYVACDPRPLARDLAAFERDGARIESVEPFEMMPQTAHVEALAIVRRPG